MIALLAVLLAQLAGTPGQIQTPNAGRWTSQQGTFLQSGAGAQLRTIASKLSDTVSVKDFGAKGDGVTDDTAAIQASFDKCNSQTPSKGCQVNFPEGVYLISTALRPKNGTEIDCAAGDHAAIIEVGGITGTVIKTTGAIWAFENPTPTTKLLDAVQMNNCSIDVSSNASSLGGLNLRSVSWSRFNNVSVLLPATGAMEGVRFDAQDLAQGGFWNELHGVIVESTGTANTHIGLRWINGANSESVFGGSFSKVGTAYSLESGNSNVIVGGGTDSAAVGCIVLGNSAAVQGNTFLRQRCESSVAGYVAVTVGAAAYNNQVLYAYVSGTPDAAHTVVDNSLGLNEVDVNDAAGNAKAYTLGNRFQNLQMGINKIGRVPGLEILGELIVSGAVITSGRTLPAYGANVVIDAALGNEFVIVATNGTAFAIANPLNSSFGGQRITIRIKNTSGGALGAVTFGTWYKLAAWAQPANAFSRSIDFEYDSTLGLWVETSRTPADVPN